MFPGESIVKFGFASWASAQVGAYAEVESCQKIVLGFLRLKLGFAARNLLSPCWTMADCRMGTAIKKQGDK